MNGKSKCKILKEIRSQIAAENDIAYVVSECKYQGDCSGTCPKCEAEVRYLEEELRKRQLAGKKVAVAGVAAAIMLSATGCRFLNILSPVTGGAPLPPSEYEEPLQGKPTNPTIQTTMGEAVVVPTTEPIDVPGEIELPEIMGDVAVSPES